MAEFEQPLHFLASGRDGGEVVAAGLGAGRSGTRRFREPCRRCQPTLDLDVFRQLRRSLGRLRMREFFQFDVAPLQNFDHARVEALARVGRHPSHRLIQR
jgi:hypothetical protein